MNQPKFGLRQEVKYKVTAKSSSGIPVQQELTFYVTGIQLTSDANGQIFEYTIAISLPDAYYGGAGFVHGVSEWELS